MLSRRSLFGSAALVVPATPDPLHDYQWEINPWRQRFEGDARVKLSEILYCEFVKQHGRDNYPGNWLTVHTKDGRNVQTELLRNQPGVLDMMHQMKSMGVRIAVIDVQAMKGAKRFNAAR